MDLALLVASLLPVNPLGFWGRRGRGCRLSFRLLLVIFVVVIKRHLKRTIQLVVDSLTIDLGLFHRHGFDHLLAGSLLLLLSFLHSFLFALEVASGSSFIFGLLFLFLLLLPLEKLLIIFFLFGFSTGPFSILLCFLAFSFLNGLLIGFGLT